MNKAKKYTFIIFLILFIVLFPLLGRYQANKVWQAEVYPTMTGSLIEIGWWLRGALGVWMLHVIRCIEKLKISKAAKYIAIFMAGTINIGLMLISEFWWFRYAYTSTALLALNILILVPIVVDKIVTKKRLK